MDLCSGKQSTTTLRLKYATQLGRVVVLSILTYTLIGCYHQSSLDIQDLAEQSPDYLWMCGYGGLVRWDISDGTRRKFNVQCTQILVDSSGDIWAAGEKRLSRYDGRSWHVYTQQTSPVQGRYIAAVSVAADGSIWVGTHGGLAGLFRYDPSDSSWQDVKRVSPSSYTPPASGGILERELPGVYAILPVSDSTVWVGTSEGVLRLGDKHQTWDEGDGLSHNSIRALAQSSDGSIWVGTVDGISRWDGLSWEAWSNPGGLPDPDGDTVAVLLATKDGSVWAAVGATVLRWDGTTWKTYDLHSGRIHAFQEMPDGELWAGTQQGLHRWAGDSWYSYDLERSADVPALLVDSQGNLWAGTTDGILYRYDSLADVWQKVPF